MIRFFRQHLAWKLLLAVGTILIGSFALWAGLTNRDQGRETLQVRMDHADHLSRCVMHTARQAMMLDARGHLNRMLAEIATPADIDAIRIMDPNGFIRFSNLPQETGRSLAGTNAVCLLCHDFTSPAPAQVPANHTRVAAVPGEHRHLAMVLPLANAPGCTEAACHRRPAAQKRLGMLALEFSLAATDLQIARQTRRTHGFAALVCLVTLGSAFLFIRHYVNRPINRLIKSTRHIAEGDYDPQRALNQADEMGQLAGAIAAMSREMGHKQKALNAQRDEYQNLFEQVPCLITVQDRNYRLLNYNQEFAGRFDPRPGDFCYHAYKGRDQKCANCQVEKTFRDGQPHAGRETGVNKDGTVFYWLYKTAPIRNAEGKIVAALEMSIDITRKHQLEKELHNSEQQYREIFNNIPNAVFVLDPDTFTIYDCNPSATVCYGFSRREMICKSFLELFADPEPAHSDNAKPDNAKPDKSKPGDTNKDWTEAELPAAGRPGAAQPEKTRDSYAHRLRTAGELNRIKHRGRDRQIIYVNIRVSPTVYQGRKALLVTASNITAWLQAEQQLAQAGKLTTLGEMSAGVAHELNQPLSVIKTVSSFFIKKLDQQESIAADMLSQMLRKVDSNVDRATNIINHMRQFARKSALHLELVHVNEVLERALEIFNQQLKLRGIAVALETTPGLPPVSADPVRLEQVFINLLLNARDAIEQKWAGPADEEGPKRITLKTLWANSMVKVEFIDTGTGMPADILGKLFEPFFTTKEVGKGTGLGLSISYGIVKDCGGEIKAANNPGGGACFSLSFPAARG